MRKGLRYALPAILVLPVFSLIAAGLAAGTMAASSAPATPPVGVPASAGQVVAYTRPLQQMPPNAGQRVFFLNPAPDIYVGAKRPHGNRGTCTNCHTILPRPQPAAAGTPAMFTPLAQQVPASAMTGGASPLQMRPYQRVYWQGLELVPLGHSLATALQVPDQAEGVAVAGASLPAGAEGFVAGDVVIAVAGQQTPDLQRFFEAAGTVSTQTSVVLTVVRAGQRQQLTLSSPSGSLGAASGVTAPMIVQGSQPPHGPRGACASCHLVLPAKGAQP